MDGRGMNKIRIKEARHKWKCSWCKTCWTVTYDQMLHCPCCGEIYGYSLKQLRNSKKRQK